MYQSMHCELAEEAEYSHLFFSVKTDIRIRIETYVTV